MIITKAAYFSERKSWRSWLEENHAVEKEIWLVYYRKSSGKPRIPYNDAVEEALCFGWIDSTVKNLDDERFAQRFTPRRKSSQLSQMNRERARKMISQKKMTGVGLKAIAHAFDPGSEVEEFVIPRDILMAIRKDRFAWKNFQGFPESYKRIRIAYIDDPRALGKEAFQKSLDNFIRKTSNNRMFGMFRE